MTRKEFQDIEESRGFNIAMAYLAAECDDVTTYEELKRCVIKHIENDKNDIALHIWNAVYQSEDVGEDVIDWYFYDYSSGTTTTPKQLLSIEDVENAGLFN